ncbi:SET domain-containing protein [Clathrospora elynae]|uniref:SET domain-containing protein n=1 Tax=Clathrospora elynae TaxID=706981 RepID=A0A6A5T7A6_9PLEO|nr:SET domain-containing protein [Clathrospora elynae]
MVSIDLLPRSRPSARPPNKLTTTYLFDLALFAREPKPSPALPSGVWPPKSAQTLLFATGPEAEDYVGSFCYTDTICTNALCRHTFETFGRSTQTWQDSFELRKTDHRGIGVYTKQAFKECDVLSWYAGELIPNASAPSDNDYLMEMPVGFLAQANDDSDAGLPSPSLSSVSADDSTVIIDDSKKANWTRFINHSCEHHCEFCLRQVGKMRTMAVEDVRDIPAGVELTVSYWSEYYGVKSRKICYCGVETCIGKSRRKGGGNGEEGLWSGKEKKVKVKKCRRVTPPLE